MRTIKIIGISTFLAIIAAPSVTFFVLMVWYADVWLQRSFLILMSGLILQGIYLWIGRLNRVHPDENGNFPMIRTRRGWMNLNLVGADTNPRAWAGWQFTNNRNGTPPREIAAGMALQRPQLPEIEVAEPNQTLLIEAFAQEL